MRLRTIAIAAVLLLAVWGGLTFWPRAPESQTALSEPEPSGATPGAHEARGVAGPIPVLTVLVAASPGPASLQPLPARGRRLLDIRDELQQRALNGDVRAACRLAFELDRCEKLPGLAKFARDIRRDANEQTDPLLREGFAKSAEYFEGRVALAQPACEGFPHHETSSAWKWELAAAQAGYPPSMVRYAWGLSLGSEGLPDGKPDAWVAFRDHAREFIERAIQAGEPAAFEIAAHAHNRSRWRDVGFPGDPVRSAAYWIALKGVASPAYSAYIDLETLERNLGAERFAQAQRLSRALAQKLAHVPPGSVDFTNGTFGREDGRHCERPPD